MTALRPANQTRRLGPMIWAAALIVLGIVGLIANMTAPAAADQGRAEQFFYLLNPIISAGIGGLIASRVPRNPAGWLVLTSMTALVVDSLSKAALHHALTGSHTFDSILSWAVWFDNWTWTIAFLPLLLLVTWFPNGQVAGPRWRWLPYTQMIVVAPLTIVCALAPKSVSVGRFRTWVRVLPDRWFDHIQGFAAKWLVMVIACLIAAIASLIVRRRRAVGAERQQIRWLIWATGAYITVNLGSALIHGPLARAGHWGQFTNVVLDCLSQIAFYGVPLAFMIAITRYGLFEIDRVISRTLSYGLITLLLGGSYLAVVAGLSFLLPARLGSIPVVLATLAVAALFVPVQRRISRGVDRRFNRSRYDAQLLVTRFAERLRVTGAEQVSPDELISTVQRALQPAHASVWLVPSSGRTA